MRLNIMNINHTTDHNSSIRLTKIQPRLSGVYLSVLTFKCL